MGIYMYRQRLCIGLSGSFGLSDEDQIRVMKQIGFDGFFFEWRRGMDVDALMKTARETGMFLQSIHAPYVKSADFWKQTEKTEDAIAELIECLEVCARIGAPIMVAHAFIGFEDHEPTEFGLKNFGRVVDAARRLGVKIAFENTEGEEYLAALMERFDDRETVGFCWDTGHEMCYNRGADMMARYGDRLFCTHLNDNLGVRDFEGKITWIDDLHMLPFDGAVDWRSVADRLDAHGYRGEMSFELTTASKPGRHENDAYARMSPEEYLTNAYIRACRLAIMRRA